MARSQRYNVFLSENLYKSKKDISCLVKTITNDQILSYFKNKRFLRNENEIPLYVYGTPPNRDPSRTGLLRARDPSLQGIPPGPGSL